MKFQVNGFRVLIPTSFRVRLQQVRLYDPIALPAHLWFINFLREHMQMPT